MSNYDWIIHYVSDTVNCNECGEQHNNPSYYKLPGFANIHTHGLNAHYNQKELCLVLNIGIDKAGPLLNSLGKRVAKGETVFTEGIRTDILKNNMDVKFISFDNDPTLYIILPDSNGYLPGDDGCEEPYTFQEEYAKIISEHKEYV